MSRKIDATIIPFLQPEGETPPDHAKNIGLGGLGGLEEKAPRGCLEGDKAEGPAGPQSISGDGTNKAQRTVQPQGAESLDDLLMSAVNIFGIETPYKVLKVTEFKTVTGPVMIAPGNTITDVEAFIASAIRDLLRYVSAENNGSRHWVRDLLDEKLERLQLCGVKAEIRSIQ